MPTKAKFNRSTNFLGFIANIDEVLYFKFNPLDMKKLWLLLFGALLIALDSPAQTKLIEKVTKKKNDEVVIPYEKYQLANGLTLIIHEDHSDPVVQVDVTYHVGSSREEIGKSGFAHFFEHMMFQGSDNVADEEHFKTVTEAGGTLNGSTNRDRTNYYETLPSNQLEIAIWLEADRMGFLLDAVTQRKFEVQRETVKNERGQNYDNRPYGLAREVIAKNLYPYGHPYSWLTIGYIKDLNRVDVNDLKNFFLRWYGPNNATLTVGGDVDPKKVIALAEKYFGPIPRGPEVNNNPKMVPTLDKDRYVSYVDNYIRVPQLYMTWPVPEQYSGDEAALDLLAEIIGQGKNSIFYKNFEKEQKARFARAMNSSSELAGEFIVIVSPYPNTSLADMEKIVRASLKEFEETGISDNAILRFKGSVESTAYNRLQSVSGKVFQLASFETYTGNPNQIQKDMERYLSLAKEDVMRVYEKYIKNKPSVILSVLPKGGEDLKAAEDNYKVDESKYKAGPDQYKGLSYKKPKDNFDRSKKPSPGANPVVNVPDYWTDKFDNGAKIIGSKYDELPIITIRVSVNGGHLLSAADPAKAGVAGLTASMMNEANEKYSSEEFDNELDKLGSSVRVSSGSDDMTVTISSTIKNLDATLRLAEARMMLPKFDEADFERLKKQQLEGIKNASTQPSTIAWNVYNKLLYGNTIRAIPQSGTEETVANITLDDVKNFYSNYFSPSAAEIVVVGRIDKADVMAKLGFIKSWKGKAVNLPSFAQASSPGNTKIFLVDVPKSAQSEIRIGYPLDIPYDATGEYYRLGLMNYALGGSFNSRINLNLREDKGWTYGARSGFSSSKLPGAFTASGGIKLNATDSAVYEFMNELKDYGKAGATPDELAFMKSSMDQRDARSYETLFQKAGFLNQIITYNLSKDFVRKQQEILKAISEKEVDGLARKYLDTEKMYVVVVGDAEKIKPGLTRLGLEIVQLDKDGNPVDKLEGKVETK